MIDHFVKSAETIWKRLGLKMLSDYIEEGKTEDLYTPCMFEDINAYVSSMAAEPQFTPPKMTLNWKQTIILGGYH
jgi:hypothetical protein